MATFNMGSAGDISLIDDIPKVQAYLYRLEKQLKYMFANLEPDENYTESARLMYVANADKQAKLEISLDQISLSMVTKDTVVSAINLSEEGVKIQGERLSLEGVTTFNNNVTIGLDGTIHANNGVFQGDISASNISGSKITAGGSDDSGITVKDNNGNVIGLWNKTGIDIRKGGIKGTSLELGGLDNVNGTLTVKNSSGTTIGTWDHDGITITNGALRVTGGGSITGSTINAGQINGAEIVLGGSGTAGSLTLKNSSNNVLASLDTTTGLTINKGSIKGSSIELGGSNNINGSLVIKNASGTAIGTWNNLGLSLGTGTISGGSIKGSDITIGGTGVSGSLTLKNSSNNTLASLDTTNGLRIYKGDIEGSSIKLGGNNNQYGQLSIRDTNDREIIKMNDDAIVLKGYNGLGTQDLEHYWNWSGISMEHTDSYGEYHGWFSEGNITLQSEGNGLDPEFSRIEIGPGGITLYNLNEQICVEIRADNNGVGHVEVNGTDLSNISGEDWSGFVDGSHLRFQNGILVEAYDT